MLGSRLRGIRRSGVGRRGCGEECFWCDEGVSSFGAVDLRGGYGRRMVSSLGRFYASGRLNEVVREI